jgi:glyoxylase-like metal-dependent hydrolase (beta-lactamase superfamily II)
MRVELLSSSIPSSDLQFLVSFLVNDEVAIDAGSLGLLADLRRQQRVKHVFITHEHLDHIATLPVFLEVSFPQSLADLATLTGHLCPTTFAAETQKLPRDLARQVRWIVVHRKARYAATIAREIEALGLPNVEFVRPGEVYEL